MALVKCPDCGAEVSTNAVTCPKCGRVMGSAAAAITQAQVAPLFSIAHLIFGCIITFGSFVNDALGPQRFIATFFGIVLTITSIFAFLSKKKWAYVTLGLLDLAVILSIVGFVLWLIYSK